MRSIRTTVSASIVITLRVYAGHNPPTITLTECLIPESDDVCETCFDVTYPADDHVNDSRPHDRSLPVARIGKDGEGRLMFALNLEPLGSPGRLPPGFLVLRAPVISPETYTPSSLRLTSDIQGVQYKASENSVTIPTSCCETQKYGGAAGSKLKPSGSNPGHNSYVEKLDEAGVPTAGDPSYLDIVFQDGNRTRFKANDTVAGRWDHFAAITPGGVLRTRGEAGMDILREADETLRQIKLPGGLVDVAVLSTNAFEIRVYSSVGPQENGVYPPGGQPVVSYRVENPQDVPADGNAYLRIMEVADGQTNTYLFAQNGEGNTTLTTGDRQDISYRVSIDATHRVDTREIRDGAGALVVRNLRTHTDFPWGTAVTREVNGDDAFGLSTDTAYYTVSSEPGRYGRVKHTVESSGRWVKYDYDAQGRVIQEIHGFQDTDFNAGTAANSRVVEYAYSGDDLRPVSRTEKLLGQLVGRTFHSRSIDPVLGYVETTEVATDPAAVAGSLSNLKTISIKYPAGSPNAGLLKSVQSPDGRLTTHDYVMGDFNPAANPAFTHNAAGTFRAHLVTEGTVTSPAGIANKTSRSVTVTDASGLDVWRETQIYDGTTYTRARATHLQYSDRLLTAETYSDGTTKSYAYYGLRLLSTTDRDGSVTEYGYDDLDRVNQVVRKGVPASGTYPAQPDLVTDYILDAAGRILQQTRSAGALSQVSSSEYDTVGRVVTSTDEQGRVTARAYSANGLVTTTTTPSLLVQTQTLYRDGSLKSSSDSLSSPTVYERGLLAAQPYARVTRGASVQTSFTDFAGRTFRQESPAFGGGKVVQTSHYDSVGRLIRTATSLEGNTVSAVLPPDTLVVYDELGAQVASAQDVNGNGLIDLAGPDRVTSNQAAYVTLDGKWYRETKSYTFPEGAVPVLVSTQRSSVGGSGCGCAAEETQSIDLLGNLTLSRTAYDPASRVTTRTVDTPAAASNQVTIVRNGLVQESIDPTGQRTLHTYDDLGRPILTSVLRPLTSVLTTTTHYNALGQVDYIEDGATNRTTFVYDDIGRRTQTIDALNQITHSAYDALGRVTNTWGATYPVSYGYDDDGRMTALKTFREENGAPDVTTWTYYPSTGLMTSKTYADGKSTTYSYDALGRLKTRTWARGIVTTYTYDLLGQLTATDYSDTTPDASFGYDRLGRQTNVVDAAGIRSFTYNENLQLETEAWNGLVNNTLTRRYDALGRNAGFETLDGMNVAYAYDSAGRFSAVTNVINGVTNTASYAYLPSSHLIAGYTLGSLSRTVDFEPDRNLIDMVTTTHGTNLISRFEYTNDPLGRRTQRLDTTGTAGFQPATNSFAYNVRSELTAATFNPLGTPITSSAAYSYDPIGNRIQAVENTVQTDYVSNMLNQYTGINANVPSYDDDGNMLSDGDSLSMTWDGENRMITTTNGNTVVVNAYDAHSRRIRKQVSVDGTPAKDIRYFYDAWNLLYEHDLLAGGSGSTRYYAWGLDLSQSLQGAGGVGGLLYTQAGTSADAPTYDANGNVTEYVDLATGAVTSRQAYDGFGKTIAQAGTRPAPYAFSTKYEDEETGLLYYGFRDYDPEIGRWPSRDRFGELMSANLYDYNFNSALFYFDAVGAVPLSCQDLKRSFDEGAMTGSYQIDMWFKLASAVKIKCPITLACDNCACPNAPARALVKFDATDSVSSVAIRICTHKDDFPGWQQEGVIHELVHAWQACNNVDAHADCNTCLCNEVQAYFFGDPSYRFDPDIDNWFIGTHRVIGSCRNDGSGTPRPCGDTSPWDLENVLKKDFIEQCVKKGFALPHDWTPVVPLPPRKGGPR